MPTKHFGYMGKVMLVDGTLYKLQIRHHRCRRSAAQAADGCAPGPQGPQNEGPPGRNEEDLLQSPRLGQKWHPHRCYPAPVEDQVKEKPYGNAL